MNFDKEFEQNMKQLMNLLKKIMSQHSLEGKSPGEIAKFLKNMKDKSPEVNIFFLNMSPLSQEEFEEIEEMLDDGQGPDYLHSGELKCELNDADEVFLKQNGIRF